MNLHYISQSEITLEKYITWANKPIGKKMRPEDADTSVKMQVNSKGERFLVWEIL